MSSGPSTTEFELFYVMATRQQHRRHVPQRTCLVCRQKTDKRRLTRIVRTAEGHVVADESGKQPGRGAYLCDRVPCWDAALRGGALKRALKSDVRREDLEQLAAYRPAAENENAL